MAVTHYTLTATFTDLLGTAYSPTSAKVVAWVETNVGSSEGIVDEVANQIALGGSRQVADSSGLVTWVDLVGSDSTPADINLESGTLQYRVSAEYVDAITRRRKTWTSGWFSLTADIDLADVISETYVPAAWMTTATATLQTYVDAGQAAATTAAAAATTASGAADTAVNAAGLASEIALGDADAALAAALANPASASGGMFAEMAALTDLRQTVTLDDTDITTSTERVIYVADAPVRLEQIALAFAAAVPASDTDYWNITVNLYRAGSLVLIASKTTKTVASGGEGITPFVGWSYDLSTWGLLRTLAAGDVLTIRTGGSGSPPALTRPVASFRVAPTDDPVLTITDDFTRGDTAASLGVTATGQTWTALAGTWGISGNKAYAAATASPQTIAVVETGVSDCVVDVKIDTMPGSCGLAVRMVDASNGWLLNNGFLYKFTAGVLDAGTAFSTSFVAGDTQRVILDGTTITVYRQAASSGAFLQVAQRTGQTHAQTATKHGIRSGSTSNLLDNFRVFA